MSEVTVNSSFKNSLSAQSSESITITSLSLTEMFVLSHSALCWTPQVRRSVGRTDRSVSAGIFQLHFVSLTKFTFSVSVRFMWTCCSFVLSGSNWTFNESTAGFRSRHWFIQIMLIWQIFGSLTLVLNVLWTVVIATSPNLDRHCSQV